MPTAPRMRSLLDALIVWGSDWRPADHEVNVTGGPVTPNPAASVQATGARTLGQITVWASGECEVEVYDSEVSPVWLQHFDLSSTDDLAEVLDRFAASVEGSLE